MSPLPPYQALRPSRSEIIPIRNLDYHVRRWDAPQADAPLLILLHGWMDSAASWQFVIDAFSASFAQTHTIIAPDWRGFGGSRLKTPSDSYHFVDYLGDLEQLLNHYAGSQPVNLVGHSMGGNVAMMYAGVRPQRIRRLVNLEGFGLPATQPEQAPRHMARWLDQLGQCQRGEFALRDYDSAEGVARRLMKTNPRLPQDKAAWLAHHWAKEDAQGRWHILGDAAHKVVSALPYRVDETLALYAAITAPVLAVQADGTDLATWWKDRYTLEEYHQRLQHVPDCRTAVVANAGHMLHHDQPQAVAQWIEEFTE